MGVLIRYLPFKVPMAAEKTDVCGWYFKYWETQPSFTPVDISIFWWMIKWVKSYYPLVMTNVFLWKDPPFFMGKFTISMVNYKWWIFP